MVDVAALLLAIIMTIIGTYGHKWSLEHRSLSQI